MSRLLSVSIPDKLAEQIETMARDQGKTKSEVVREGLRDHVGLSRWRALQREGQRLAEERGIGPEDVEDLVDEVRAEMQAERRDT